MCGVQHAFYGFLFHSIFVWCSLKHSKLALAKVRAALCACRRSCCRCSCFMPHQWCSGRQAQAAACWRFLSLHVYDVRPALAWIYNTRLLAYSRESISLSISCYSAFDTYSSLTYPYADTPPYTNERSASFIHSLRSDFTILFYFFPYKYLASHHMH